MHPVTAAVDQHHQRDPAPQREVAHRLDLLHPGVAEAAAEDGEVAGEDRDRPAVDLAGRRDQAVGGRQGRVDRGDVGGHQGAHLERGALVEEQVDPLARGQLAGVVLTPNRLRSRRIGHPLVAARDVSTVVRVESVSIP